MHLIFLTLFGKHLVFCPDSCIVYIDIASMLVLPLFVLQSLILFVFAVQASQASSLSTVASYGRVSGDAPLPTTTPGASLVDALTSKMKERLYYGEICKYASSNVCMCYASSQILASLTEFSSSRQSTDSTPNDAALSAPLSWYRSNVHQSTQTLVFLSRPGLNSL